MLNVKPKDIPVLKRIFGVIANNPHTNPYQIAHKSRPRLDRITVMRKIAKYRFVENRYLRHKKGKRNSHCYSITLRGLIFALKLKALKPSEASTVLKEELDRWFGKGVKVVRHVYGKKLEKKYKEYVELIKPVIFNYFDTHPKDFCNFLTRFDLDFCEDYLGPWSIFFEITVFILVQGSIDERFQKKLKRESIRIEPIAKELISAF